MPFNVAAVQFSPKKGDIGANIQRVGELALEASSQGADLCIFPESALVGYSLEAGAEENSLYPQELNDLLTKRLANLDQQLDIVVGFYEKTSGQPYNSAAYLQCEPGGQCTLIHVYRKFFLPTYGVFDEERFHTRGKDIGVFETRFGRFGILICEDVWHSVLSTLSAMSGAQFLIVPSASPARGMTSEIPGNVMRYERMLRSLAEEHGMFTAASMLTGFEAGKGFSGGSMIFDPYGSLMVSCPAFEEAMVIAEIDLNQVQIARNKTPLLGDLKSVWGDISRIVSEIS